MRTAPRPWAPRRCSHGPAKETDTRRAKGHLRRTRAEGHGCSQEGAHPTKN